MAREPDDRLIIHDTLVKLRRERALMRLSPEQFGEKERRQGWYKDKMARADATKTEK